MLHIVCNEAVSVTVCNADSFLFFVCFYFRIAKMSYLFFKLFYKYINASIMGWVHGCVVTCSTSAGIHYTMRIPV